MLKAGLQHRTGVGVAITPSLRTGMDLLRLPPYELAERLREEAQANPLLIVEDRPFPPSRGTSVDVADLAIAADTTLAAELRSQIGMMSLTPNVRALAEYMTGTLDDRGFLTQSRAELAVETRFPLAVVDEALAAIWACEPAGVGARSLQHCLALQLERTGMAPDRAMDVVEAFEPLMTGDWARAQTLLGENRATLEALAEQLYSLDVDPARAFTDGPELHLVPDLLVERGGKDTLSVAVYDSWMPRVSVDRILRIQGQEDAESRDFVEERVRAAEALIRGVEFRKRTLLRLGEYLINAQRNFFRGRDALPAPLNRSDAAKTLGVHASTIGRALRGRALEFEGRVIRLDWFFPRRLETDTGMGISTLAAQDLMRKLVSSEAPEKPLSDTEIARQLKDAGVDIARRTVAKYRDAMNIPASHIRRRLAARSQRRAT